MGHTDTTNHDSVNHDSAVQDSADGGASTAAAPRVAAPAPRELGVLVAILLLACVLALTNLDAQALWQDEAQSALLSRSALENGIPLGTDGRNFFSQEFGAEYDEAYRWRWHTWLHFYLVAASFALFGEGTLAARLPAALAGVATVLAVWALARALWRRPLASLGAAAALTASVPFWILARQCRYYSLTALFATLALLGYQRLLRAERGGALLLVASLLGLFHAHYVYVPPLAAALGLHAALFGRARLRSLLGALCLTALLCAPWVLWQSGMEYGARYGADLLDPTSWARKAAIFAGKIARHALTPAFLVASIAAVAGLAGWRGSAAVRRLLRDSGAAVVALSALAIYATVSVVSPDAFFRYLTPLLPLAALAVGGFVEVAGRVHPLLALGVAAAFALPQPARGFAYELTHDFGGPIETLVEYLGERAGADDTVLITYGDLPLKFYTELRVLGGLTGEDLTEALQPEWVVVRHHVVHVKRDGLVAAFIEREIDLVTAYRKIRLPVADTAFENREEPAEHRFRTASGGPALELYRRR